VIEPGPSAFAPPAPRLVRDFPAVARPSIPVREV